MSRGFWQERWDRDQSERGRTGSGRHTADCRLDRGTGVVENAVAHETRSTARGHCAGSHDADPGRLHHRGNPAVGWRFESDLSHDGTALMRGAAVGRDCFIPDRVENPVPLGLQADPLLNSMEVVAMIGPRQIAQAQLFYEFSPKAIVPPDHLLRSMDRFVDLSAVRPLLVSCYSSTGRNSVDPEWMFLSAMPELPQHRCHAEGNPISRTCSTHNLS